MSVADEIARLYQLTPAEFTAARNDLVKKLKPAGDKAEVRALQKPSVPAWVVNQLYWQRRKVFSQLVDAARRLRNVHGQQLAGRHPDLEAAERVHREALKAATDAIRDILASSGEKASSQTMGAVMGTLQALPGRDDYGRLTKPLKPLGFEALAGLVSGGGATIARLADRRPPEAAPAGPKALGSDKRADKPDKRDKAELQAAAKRAAIERQKRVAAAERELRKAMVAEREATADFSRAEVALARVQRDRKDLQVRLDELTARRDDLSLELDQRRKESERAASERERLERALAGARGK